MAKVLAGPRAMLVSLRVFKHLIPLKGKKSQFKMDTAQRGGKRPGDILNQLWARTVVLLFTAPTNQKIEAAETNQKIETVEVLEKNVDETLTHIQTLLREAPDPAAEARDLVYQAKLVMNDIVPALDDEKKASFSKDLDQCPFSYPDPWKLN